MAYAKITGADAVLIVRAMGLLVSQAGIYGAQHNVTQTAARSVFVELEAALKKYGPVEFSVGENRLLINGEELAGDAAAGKNLLDRMNLYHVGGFLLSPPLDLREYLFFVGLFGTPPQTLMAEGGFEAALKKSGYRSVQVVNVSYKRVKGDAPPAPEHEAGKSRFLSAEASAPRAIDAQARAAPRKEAVLDLSAVLSGAAPLNAAGADAGDAPQPQEKESLSASTRRQRAQALAAMLRDAASVLERGAAEDAEAVTRVLGQIRSVLADMAAGSQRGISALASEVEEDSKTIASIESAAKRRGIGLKLTRRELLRRYAELNQEIVQPLTVSSGVIDLLHSGQAGVMSESQRELLKMASESMDRVNQLVTYLNRVSGLPESLTPDVGLIADTYRA